MLLLVLQVLLLLVLLLLVLLLLVLLLLLRSGHSALFGGLWAWLRARRRRARPRAAWSECVLIGAVLGGGVGAAIDLSRAGWTRTR